VGVWTTKEHEMSEHCETANTNMYPAIPCLAGDIASGRAEETRPSSQKIYNVIFCEKDRSSTMLPQANLISIW